MMGGYGSPYGFGYNPIGTILSLVFWALIIVKKILTSRWLQWSLIWLVSLLTISPNLYAIFTFPLLTIRLNVIIYS